MMSTFPFLIVLYAGFVHAFEADHLLAVSTIVSQRNHLMASVKDGVFWGLGHASTILLIGSLMIIGKTEIPASGFQYAEAAVGLMLVILALLRLFRLWKNRAETRHQHTFHLHHPDQGHRLAYAVGIVHGLAGSGALVLLVMTQMQRAVDGLLYLLVFGVGCMAGMLLAAGLFAVPFSQKIIRAPLLQKGLVALSAILCIGYGLRIFFRHLSS